MTGLFIAFEGGDGAGKSTQSNLLNVKLKCMGLRTTLLHEPGSTPVGDYLRQYLISDEPVSQIAELLMFEASRAELVASQITPALKAGAVVICDRFAGSTLAYQGYGRDLNLDGIQWLNDFATRGLYPDLTILLDIDPLLGLERAHNRQFQLAFPIGDAPDRFEEEEIAFHYRVRHGFNKIAEDNRDTWKQIDANRTIDKVEAAIWGAVSPLLTGMEQSADYAKT